jgi:hypothetical protein
MSNVKVRAHAGGPATEDAVHPFVDVIADLLRVTGENIVFQETEKTISLHKPSNKQLEIQNSNSCYHNEHWHLVCAIVP